MTMNVHLVNPTPYAADDGWFAPAFMAAMRSATPAYNPVGPVMDGGLPPWPALFGYSNPPTVDPVLTTHQGPWVGAPTQQPENPTLAPSPYFPSLGLKPPQAPPIVGPTTNVPTSVDMGFGAIPGYAVSGNSTYGRVRH